MLPDVRAVEEGRRGRSKGEEPIKEEWMDLKEEKPVINLVPEQREVKGEEINMSLLPDSPPRSPLKDEASLTDAELDQKRSGSSRQASLSITDSPRNGSSSRLSNGPTQYASHLPKAEETALKTFEQLKGNLYQNGKVGRTRGHEKEAMVCECRYRFEVDDPSMACTEEADCINRLTQVECLKAECHCGKYCQNQRFQRCQYADVEIIQTEKKGFGLRAGADLTADTFIYEYIGEVVEQKEFLKRMQQYRDEGIRHFYFMMLQREEFLDATRRGGIARFVNHSCNPNCYVSKWHVGKYMRMGIFAKRDIQKGEELTFNYNVDRYGNDAQPCYCGEPNCVGSIGGKTQTDIGGMDQLLLDGLGISAQVDQLEAKGTRRKKSKQLDEDFTPLLRPIEEEEVAKVITAIRQATSNRNILQKLLHRIHITQDTIVQRCLVRLHGFVLMASVVDEWQDDKEIILLTMGSLARWPLIAKNKVVDSGIDRLVQDLSKRDDAEIGSLASDLLNAWDALEMSYRIARKEPSSANEAVTPVLAEVRKTTTAEDDLPMQTSRRLEDAQAPNSVSNRLEAIAPKPLGSLHNRSLQVPPVSQRERGWKGSHDSPTTPQTPDEYRTSPTWASYWGSGRSRPQTAVPSSAAVDRIFDTPRLNVKAPAPKPMSIEEIIRKANEADILQRKQAEEAKAAEEAAKLETEQQARERQGLNGGSNGTSSKRRHSPSGSDGPTDKRPRDAESASDVAERRLKKAVGEVVVGCMSMHKDALDRDTFKKHARELTHIICGKEKRSAGSAWPPEDGLANGMSKEKTKKIKNFAIDYVTKLVARKSKSKGGDVSKTEVGSDSKSNSIGGDTNIRSLTEFVPTTPPRSAFSATSGQHSDTPKEHD